MKFQFVHRFSFLTTIVAGIALLIATPRASAEWVTFDWKGIFTEATDRGSLLHKQLGDLNLLVGQPISGSFGYDTAAPTSLGAEGHFFLWGPEVGFSTFSFAGGSVQAAYYSVDVIDAAPGLSNLDTITMWAPWEFGQILQKGTIFPMSIPYIDNTLVFQGPPTVFSGTALPVDIDLTKLQAHGVWRAWDPWGEENYGEENLQFDITSITRREVQGKVPDAGATAVLLLFACPALCFVRRRCKL